MINWRLSHEPVNQEKDGTVFIFLKRIAPDFLDEKARENVRCTIFLGYTSNMVSSGNREIIRYLV
jgi:deoxyhypusine synthase